MTFRIKAPVFPAPALRSRDDRTRLSYWFPLIEAAGLPVPKTEIIQATDAECRGFWELEEGRPSDAVDQLAARIRAAGERMGAPFFLRTDYTSGKHDWERTCYVSEVEVPLLREHLYALFEYSQMADMIGLPHDVWAVREFLCGPYMFTAFRNMPIKREFRFFVRDGVIEHWQPYWPIDSLHNVQQITSGTLDDWYPVLAALDEPTRAELEPLVLRVSAAVPGYWSVDLLETPCGWYVTDMAEGEKSFRYNRAPDVVPAPADKLGERGVGAERLTSA